MAFKMKGMHHGEGTGSSNAFKKARGENLWGKVKSKAKGIWDKFNDSSINMTNITGMGPEWAKQQRASRERSADLYKKARNKEISFEEYKKAME